jgi:Gram-negative porin
MKKTLVALAVLAASGASFAQVSLTGLAGFAYQKSASQADGKATTGFGVPDLALTATASEDLGGGTKVTATVGWDIGGARNSGSTRDDYTLVTSGSFGTVAMYSAEAGNNAEQFSGVVSLANGADSTASAYKSILGHANVKGTKYTTPALIPGLTLTVGYSQYEANTASTTPAINNPTATGYQTSTSFTGKYVAGPLMAVYTRAQYNTSINGAAFTDSAKDDIGLSYDMGVAKFGLGYVRTSSPTIPAADVTGTTVASVAVPMGAVTFGLDYANKQAATAANDSITYLAAGVSYNLSKTAVVKASVGGFTGITALSGAGAPTTDTQYRIGMWKSF